MKAYDTRTVIETLSTIVLTLKMATETIVFIQLKPFLSLFKHTADNASFHHSVPASSASCLSPMERRDQQENRTGKKG